MQEDPWNIWVSFSLFEVTLSLKEKEKMIHLGERDKSRR